MSLQGFIDVEVKVKVFIDPDDESKGTTIEVEEIRVPGSQFGEESSSIYKAFHSNPDFDIEYYVDIEDGSLRQAYVMNDNQGFKVVNDQIEIPFSLIRPSEDDDDIDDDMR
jgi:hypothetical protein